jgi:hypothetical protein
MPKVSFRMASASRESVFGVETNTARKIHRSDHTEGRLSKHSALATPPRSRCRATSHDEPRDSWRRGSRNRTGLSAPIHAWPTPASQRYRSRHRAAFKPIRDHYRVRLRGIGRGTHEPAPHRAAQAIGVRTQCRKRGSGGRIERVTGVDGDIGRQCRSGRRSVRATGVHARQRCTPGEIAVRCGLDGDIRRQRCTPTEISHACSVDRRSGASLDGAVDVDAGAEPRQAKRPGRLPARLRDSFTRPENE